MNNVLRNAELLDIKNNNQSEDVLPTEFWDALIDGKYKNVIFCIFSYHIEVYAKLMNLYDNESQIEFINDKPKKPLGFSYSLYRNNYVIDILAVKNMCYISIRSKGENSRLLGVISLDISESKSQKTNECKYYDRLMQDQHPIALSLLNKIKKEVLKKNITIKTKTLTSGTLPFKKSIKKLVGSVKWCELIKLYPQLTPKERAEKVAADLNIDPVTIAGYGSSFSDKRARKEANKAYGVIKESKHDITEKWSDLIQKEPKLSPMERAEILTANLNIDPATIAGYAKFSKVKTVKLEAYKAYNSLLDKKHGITRQWKLLIKERPEFTPKERAEQISIKKKIEPVTVAWYARASEDQNVRSEAVNALNTLLDAKHGITEQWKALIDTKPNLSAIQRVKIIAAKEFIEPLTVATYALYSKDERVKSEANYAYDMVQNKRHRITEYWQALIEKKPDITSEERVEELSDKIGLNPITISKYGKVSDDINVKSDAIQAIIQLLEKKHSITRQWKLLIKERPEFTPKERAQKISFQVKLDPVTIAGYARASEDQNVRSEAVNALNTLLDAKHGITEQWKALIDTKPNLSAIQRVKIIAAKESIEPLTVATYGRYSKDKRVKSEAHKVANFYARPT